MLITAHDYCFKTDLQEIYISKHETDRFPGDLHLWPSSFKTLWLLITVFCSEALCFWFQDPSSPRSVQSYSSRENGLDKMPPSRKEGPPQASPTSLASSSSAASPSRGKEPPQVEAHICMNTSGPHKKTNIWIAFAEHTLGIFQYRTSVFPCCQHTLYSACFVRVNSSSQSYYALYSTSHTSHSLGCWHPSVLFRSHLPSVILTVLTFVCLLFFAVLLLLPRLAPSSTIKLCFPPIYLIIYLSFHSTFIFFSILIF